MCLMLCLWRGPRRNLLGLDWIVVLSVVAECHVVEPFVVKVSLNYFLDWQSCLQGVCGFLCPFWLHLPPLGFCLQPASVSLHWNTSRGLAPLNFGLISMHLFHCSRLLLSWVLESIQGEELIDLRPDGGIMSVVNQRPGAVFRSCGGF